MLGLLATSLLLQSQRFGQYVLWLSSRVSFCAREYTYNFEPNPLIEPSALNVPILLTMTGTSVKL